MADAAEYETIVGLEVHAQLLTHSKLFSSDPVVFGDEPNTNLSVITLAHPGTLPKTNKRAVEFAIKMGLACNCTIENDNYFARKNYFYPDLPKGYQVSQHTTPVCKNGFLDNVRINRIHLEEDAGKSFHGQENDFSSIDLNRAGTPLIEIVSEPDIRSGEQAHSFLTSIRKLVRYLGICDGNMEEGSLRCDANVSVRRKGESKLNTRVEIKNLNSIRNVKRAIEAEAARQVGILEAGGQIIQETRSFDDITGKSFSSREKEDADDYRYFAEPDIPPFHITEEFIEEIRKNLPELQPAKASRFMDQYGLTSYESEIITEDRMLADYFEQMSAVPGIKTKSVANWLLGPVKAWMKAEKKAINELPVVPIKLSELASLVDEGRLSFSAASGKLFPILVRDPGKKPADLATELNLFQQSDESELSAIIDSVLSGMQDKVKEYKKGKKGLLSLFVGEVMKRSKGKADPKITNELLVEKLKTL
jgi:aspartyl-tRNA(Asn)/glutamyl-tRNA(Gln) amidotransferase subunit B